MNQVVYTGRLTKDPVLQSTGGGVAKVTFTLAVTRDFKDKQTGEREADFILCIAYRNQANAICNFVKKGHRLGVIGKTRTFRKDDQTTVTYCEVGEIDFLQPRETNNSSAPSSSFNNPPPGSSPYDHSYPPVDNSYIPSDDELPF